MRKRTDLDWMTSRTRRGALDAAKLLASKGLSCWVQGCRVYSRVHSFKEMKTALGKWSAADEALH